MSAGSGGATGDPEALRRRIRDLLEPAGEALGRQGRRRGIRVLPGGIDAARELFARLAELGTPVDVPGYDGALVDLGEEGRVGFRGRSRSGEPTIDVSVQSVPTLATNPGFCRAPGE